MIKLRNTSMKLIAADYDGTIRYKETVTPEDISSIRKWQEAGNLFVIDTGRSMESILQETEKYGLKPDYFITNNGGMLFDGKQNMLFSSYLDNVMSLDIMYIAKQTGGVVSYVVNDGFRRHRIIINPSLSENRYPSLDPDMSEEDLMKLGKYAQFVISMDTLEAALKLAEEVNRHFSSHVEAYANRYVADIVPRGMSKASGIELVRQRENISLEDVYTLGDADNDITMMEYGLHGGCMAASPEEIRSHAVHIWQNVSELIETLLSGKER